MFYLSLGLFFYMYVLPVHVCVCMFTVYMPGACRERASDPLELELRRAVSHRVGAGCRALRPGTSFLVQLM